MYAEGHTLTTVFPHSVRPVANPLHRNDFLLGIIETYAYIVSLAIDRKAVVDTRGFIRREYPAYPLRAVKLRLDNVVFVIAVIGYILKSILRSRDGGITAKRKSATRTDDAFEATVSLAENVTVAALSDSDTATVLSDFNRGGFESRFQMLLQVLPAEGMA